MSVDLSWIWEWLGSVVDTINSFFQNLWSQIQNISNTGQGLFAGLSAFGSMIWDGIRYLSDKVKDAFNFFVDVGNSIKNAFIEFGKWVWSTFANLPNAIYSALQWIYNGAIWLGSQVSNIFASVYNFFASAIEGISSTFQSWVDGFREAINNWWTNMVIGFRNKLKTTIMTNLSIILMWKGFEKAIESPEIKSIGMAIVTPFLAPIGGSIVAEMIDRIVPKPSTSTYELVPPVTIPTITMPRLEVPTAPYPAPPEVPPTPAIGYGLPYDVEIEMPDIWYDITPETTDKTLDMPSLEIETEVS